MVRAVSLYDSCMKDLLKINATINAVPPPTWLDEALDPAWWDATRGELDRLRHHHHLQTLQALRDETRALERAIKALQAADQARETPNPNGISQIAELLLAISAAVSDSDERQKYGQLVRVVTRRWAELNPEFDSDAWYPVSFLLTEHWDAIRERMESL